MKTRFYISGEKSKRRIISIFMSVIVLINIIVPVYASAADVADNNSCVTGEGLEIPKAFEICSQRTDKAENEYVVSLNVTNDWGNRFTGEIKIQNLSAEPIEAWRLNFDTNFTIEDIWNARLVSADANSYSIVNDITTTPIAANETKTFGFKALKERGVTAEIFNCIVNGVTINENFESLEFLETGLLLTVFAQYN